MTEIPTPQLPLRVRHRIRAIALGNAIGDGIVAQQQQIGITPQEEQQMESELAADTSVKLAQDGVQLEKEFPAMFGQENAQTATASGSTDTTTESPLTNNVELSSSVTLQPSSLVTFNPNDISLPNISLGDLNISAGASASPAANSVTSASSAVGSVTSDSSPPAQLQEVVVSAEAPWWMRAWNDITTAADAVGSDVSNAYHAVEGDVGAAVSGMRNFFSQPDSTQSDSAVWPGETAALRKMLDDPTDPLYVLNHPITPATSVGVCTPWDGAQPQQPQSYVGPIDVAEEARIQQLQTTLGVIFSGPAIGGTYAAARDVGMTDAQATQLAEGTAGLVLSSVAPESETATGVADATAVMDTGAGNSSAFTFRGDSRSPDVIFNEGFAPRGDSTDLLAHALDNTDPPSAFVATSQSFDAATDFSNNIYVVRPVNGIDVNAVLGSQSPYPWEQEIAIPGGVAPSDIRGVTLVDQDISILNPNWKP